MLKTLVVKSMDYYIKDFSRNFTNCLIGLKLNGKEVREIFPKTAAFVFDVCEFKRSINFSKSKKPSPSVHKHKDKFFFFVCGCGNAGCDGWFNGVSILHKKGKIIWKIREDSPKRKIDLIFDEKDYFDFNNRITTEFLHLLKSDLLKSSDPEDTRYLTLINLLLICNNYEKITDQKGLELMKLEIEKELKSKQRRNRLLYNLKTKPLTFWRKYKLTAGSIASGILLSLVLGSSDKGTRIISLILLIPTLLLLILGIRREVIWQREVKKRLGHLINKICNKP